MITYTEHLARILGSIEPLPASSYDLSGGAEGISGTVLAADVVSTVPLPGFTNSAMDGYAVRSCDVPGPVTLEVSGDIPAGDTRSLRVQDGKAWRIMTGAPVPGGADTIVPVELTDGGVNRVRFDGAAEPGRHIRWQGEHAGPDEVLVPAGTLVAPHHVAVIASAGVTSVSVHPRPRVAVVSTGDELQPAGSRLEHGHIHDSNGPMLAALVAAAGAELHSLHHLHDTETSVRETLDALTAPGGADLIVTTGGVSAGAFDVVKGALREAGEVRFDKVAMQPGKPQGYGLLGPRRVPVLTLPGNPMSTLVSFHAFALPALRHLAGRPQPQLQRGIVTTEWPSTPGRAQFARVDLERIDGTLHVTPNSRQGSHHLGELAHAKALAVIPAQIDHVSEGDEVDVMMLLGESWI